MANEQISLPYLVVILLVTAFVIRFLFFSPPATAVGAGAAPRQSAQSVLRTREAAVERIQQMFPQVDRRTILWDLQRSGGNIQATSERILAGRLETPPITFQPPPPPGANNAAASAPTPVKAADKPTQPDLITRYKLQDKVAAQQQKQQQAEADKAGKGWSSNRDERQSLLQKRRDEMILAARRKMEAKIAAEKATS
ncbi:Coupling of ubiquitin conjugation to ER degradation protein 1 [Colletotrichum chlorophyti]|uniref:Coupling of ubiquitin conjugation to ER degradation protein 1 n=1 Tax=Colletotrichum chlorophyti TaxID=708187 RepID=A0A1Q8RV99_9PEZI|nr:Coupling of ubiquitin conjugation to ER degradation protein 1 [Colletotrichum chlorophyti]